MKTYLLECPICQKVRKYKSYSALCLSVKRNSNCRSCATVRYAKREGDCSILLDGSNVSYYWLGFILADGHIENSTRLSVRLGLKDIDHLEKLSKYLKVKMTKNDISCLISIMDSVSIRKLCENFSINSDKTTHPPNISVLNIERDKLLSLFCGFIDGDGCIGNLHNRVDFNLRVRCHSSWLEILSFFSSKFLNNCSTKIDNRGYSILCCGNTELLKGIKKECLKLNIPLMNRKWNIINLNYKGRNEISRERISRVEYYLSIGYSQKEIGNILNISKSGISLIIKRNSLK